MINCTISCKQSFLKQKKNQQGTVLNAPLNFVFVMSLFDALHTLKFANTHSYSHHLAQAEKLNVSTASPPLLLLNAKKLRISRKNERNFRNKALYFHQSYLYFF